MTALRSLSSLFHKCLAFSHSSLCLSCLLTLCGLFSLSLAILLFYACFCLLPVYSYITFCTCLFSASFFSSPLCKILGEHAFPVWRVPSLPYYLWEEEEGQAVGQAGRTLVEVEEEKERAGRQHGMTACCISALHTTHLLHEQLASVAAFLMPATYPLPRSSLMCANTACSFPGLLFLLL